MVWWSPCYQGAIVHEVKITRDVPESVLSYPVSYGGTSECCVSLPVVIYLWKAWYFSAPMTSLAYLLDGVIQYHTYVHWCQQYLRMFVDIFITFTLTKSEREITRYINSWYQVSRYDYSVRLSLCFGGCWWLPNPTLAMSWACQLWQKGI